MVLKVEEFARVFDFANLANHLHERLRGQTLATFEDALRLLPELNGSQQIGFDGRGQMAFRVLARDEYRLKPQQQSTKKLVLAALYNCAAPPHLHSGGECIVTLRGVFREHTWNEGCAHRFDRHPDDAQAEQWPEGLTMHYWGGEAFHQPYTGDHELWIGLCHHPVGSRVFLEMTKKELALAFNLAMGDSARMPHDWQEMSEEDARQWLARALDLKYRYFTTGGIL